MSSLPPAPNVHPKPATSPQCEACNKSTLTALHLCSMPTQRLTDWGRWYQMVRYSEIFLSSFLSNITQCTNKECKKLNWISPSTRANQVPPEVTAIFARTSQRDESGSKVKTPCGAEDCKRNADGRSQWANQGCQRGGSIPYCSSCCTKRGGCRVHKLPTTIGGASQGLFPASPPSPLESSSVSQSCISYRF